MNTPDMQRGLCQCGCGRRTTVATHDRLERGEKKGEPRRFIAGHHRTVRSAADRGSDHANHTPGRHIDRQGYVLLRMPDHPSANKNGYVREHVLVAERALGKRLPSGAVVHHINGVRSDNRPQNLVICQDQAYHKMIERRATALAVSGRADYRLCGICRRHDAPENLYFYGGGSSARHRACHAAAEAKRYRRDRAEDQLAAREDEAIRSYLHLSPRGAA